VIEQPDVRPVGEVRYRLHDDYTYNWDDNGACFRIQIPRGFVYDGASVPRVLWSVTGLRPDGLIRAAALVHDYFYRWDGVVPFGSYQVMLLDGRWVSVDTPMTRSNADKLFKRMMADAGISPHLVWMAWSGVRMGGWISWGKR
jgi:hypothetical protein